LIVVIVQQWPWPSATAFDVDGMGNIIVPLQLLALASLSSSSSKTTVLSWATVASASALPSRRRIAVPGDRGRRQQLQLLRRHLLSQSPPTVALAFIHSLPIGINSRHCYNYNDNVRRLTSMTFHSSPNDNEDEAAAISKSSSGAAESASLSRQLLPIITPHISSRTLATLDPCVILMKQLISQHAHKWEGGNNNTNSSNHDNHPGIYSLAQGVVYWRPPSSAYEAIMRAVQENIIDSTDGTDDDDDDGNSSDDPGDGRLIHTYCPDEGYPPLLSALQHKLQKENGLSNNPHIIVTSGANQAYVNCVLTLLDERTRRCKVDVNESATTHRDDGISRGSRSHHQCIDKCVVFEPYYFNHVMAIQSVRGGRGCGGTAAMADTILINKKESSPSTPTTSSCDDHSKMVEGLLVGPTIRGVPDLQWLRSKLDEFQYNDHDHGGNTTTTPTTTTKNAIRMVTLVNPGNPTGIALPHSFLKDMVQLTKEYGVWLIMDNTYEHFDVNGENRLPPPHLDDHDDDTTIQQRQQQQPQPDFPCFDEEHVINIFSFSKGYAMAGFRVGYIVLSSKNGSNGGAGAGTIAYNEMLKVQDTIAICASRISQMAALGALQAGREWVHDRVKTLDIGRAAIIKAMSSLENCIGGNGAMYIMGQLPHGVDDRVSYDEHNMQHDARDIALHYSLWSSFFVTNNLYRVMFVLNLCSGICKLVGRALWRGGHTRILLWIARLDSSMLFEPFSRGMLQGGIST
jgi:aspartate/methionine/tyrosine aminotransferase